MVRERPAGDPAQRAEAGGVSEVRGNWNAFAASPSILSLWKGQRRMAKTGETANEGAEVEAGSEPDMFRDGASVAAE